MEHNREEILNNRTGKVTDFLELTLSDGIVIRDITDMGLIVTTIEDCDSNNFNVEIFNVEIITGRATYIINLDIENYFLLLDDLEK